MHRRCIASVLMLLVLVACVHDRNASRPPAPETTTSPSTPAPASPASHSVPSSAPAPQAPTSSAPPPAASTAPPLPKAGSQAGAERTSPSPRRTSPPEIASPAAPAQATQPPTASAGATRPRTGAAATPTLDLNALQQRLRDTRAIGLFTKLSLKNQVDDLLAQFRSFHKGSSAPSLAELRQKFELLLMKVVTLLQDGDPSLAAAVSSSRDEIWGVLSDPRRFANI